MLLRFSCGLFQQGIECRCRLAPTGASCFGSTSIGVSDWSDFFRFENLSLVGFDRSCDLSVLLVVVHHELRSYVFTMDQNPPRATETGAWFACRDGKKIACDPEGDL